MIPDSRRRDVGGHRHDAVAVAAGVPAGRVHNLDFIGNKQLLPVTGS
jgi:hypothetical protein